MKHILLTTIATVMMVRCGESESTAKAPDISIHEAAGTGNIEALKQHLAAGTDVNEKDNYKSTPLHLRLVKAMEHLNILQRYHDFSVL
ncbi:ankyrin repeat domain-containing protein [Verrucomicrobia bacterium]|nr:ankyrin repeat domain-containing protein [Verrucomicrobiota bacterium]